MEPFTTLTATAAPLLRDDIDTDAIIPSREMRSPSGQGLAEGLFAGWRYKAIGSRDPNPDFVLNQPVYAGARILLTGANVGCGSSREHAVWALAQYGIRAVIAPSFNPIFRGNCIANGVVPVSLPMETVSTLASALEAAGQPELTVDLEQQLVVLPDGQQWSFDIEPEVREALMLGLDPIDLTLRYRSRIQDFRATDHDARPWIYFRNAPSA
ncbi:3-isopropylmalate dehydratase small subunit [Croceicoccus estronivorus]|uniref:3-isopropylmalate dehydratase small subunit n=1 Tax=Croceicoccus estronivorus TaxID=1172626 RepID=UPI00082CE370|nr:3-isopropylmalate dehydratase small subunit [Croceicoccus estronivorus]OCC23566.1 3-isopropylmalate dehydratase small subunit [Croceicoccus estronivorus]